MKEVYRRNIKNLLKILKKKKIKKNKTINMKHSSEEEMKVFYELLLEILEKNKWQ